MLVSAPRPCPRPGCGRLVRDGKTYCAAHRAQRRREQDAKRGNSRERGYTARWDTARASFLRQHPLCAHCEQRGLVVLASVVDHIVPHKGDQEKFWDAANLQPLCARCHSRKTAREDGGFGRVLA